MGKKVKVRPAAAPATGVNIGRVVGYKDEVGYLVAFQSDAGFELTAHEKLFVQVPLQDGETGWWLREEEMEVVK